MLWHDATVSVLRAYAADELSRILNSIDGSDKFQVSVFRSCGYGEWLGLPEWMNSVPYLSLEDPVIQYLFVAPIDDHHSMSSQMSG